MKAIVAHPKTTDAARLIDLPEPALGPGQALLRSLQVGVCGTDAEILAGLYGEAPSGERRLVLGHESFCRVEDVDRGVRGVAPGDYVCAVVRRPDDCLNCRNGEPDMCLTGNFKERGIKGLHGFLAEYVVDDPAYLVKVPARLKDIGVWVEPLSVVEKALARAFAVQRYLVWQPKRAVVLGAGPIGMLAMLLLRLRDIEVYVVALEREDGLKGQLAREAGATFLSAARHPVTGLAVELGQIDLIFEATGNSTVSFQALSVLGNNGVLCLTGVSAGHRRLEVPSDALNLSMVLGNKLVFGSVNANIRDWRRAVRDLGHLQRRFPHVVSRLITGRYAMQDFSRALQRGQDDIKSVIHVTPP